MGIWGKKFNKEQTSEWTMVRRKTNSLFDHLTFPTRQVQNSVFDRLQFPAIKDYNNSEVNGSIVNKSYAVIGQKKLKEKFPPTIVGEPYSFIRQKIIWPRSPRPPAVYEIRHIQGSGFVGLDR
jgi:hypothetical protein